MSNFSIGEMSKLNNISIQTLRYYDKIGLLKPKVISEKSQYRYYSIEQFFQMDVIKYYKTLGLSLDEIKKLMGRSTSMEEKLDMINFQQEVLENKLLEMEIIKNHLEYMKNTVSSIIEYETDKIFIKYNEKREYISYDCVSATIDELEINYRKVMPNSENQLEKLSYELSSMVSYDELKEKMVYKNIMTNNYVRMLKNEGRAIVLPEGEYITIYFEGGCFENKKYYNKIIDYINKNNIKISGDFHEVYILPQVNEDGKENTLMKLEIMKKRINIC
ncbi:MerR family transcriptional regulator [Clostridium diolis]|uniref:MerR family transcriptional regulator n=1 Tax=Clostridium diolis TaxID=223919 RepID=A0AAV3W3Z4_9CLOT|nr:MerR family transcriptional regulator [Clostridium diolis]QES71740.1 MerR family transcriptional regulator [Clostridium diolis]GEA33080.1 MerR family transcriptional regulator [Clostridium diolis]